MASAEEIRQWLMLLIENGLYAKLTTPFADTKHNGRRINEQAAYLVREAVNAGIIDVDMHSRIIYIPGGDEYLNLLPAIPLLYSSMINEEFEVRLRISEEVLGRVKYGGYPKQAHNGSFVVGVETTFTFYETMKYVEVKLDGWSDANSE